MDEKQKNAVMIAIVAGLAGFNIMWWMISSFIWGGLAGILVGAIFAAAGYFATQFLS